MATTNRREMYNRYNRPGRKTSWERVGQGAATGAIEGGTLGSAFGPKGAAIGAAAGGIIGGGLGYLSSPKEVDPLLYQEMIDRYSKGRRYQARTAANQLSADIGAGLASRGLNQSQLGAGIVAGNRGRLMAMAERDISNFQAGVYREVARAKYNAEHAENQAIRQGWVDLARQIAFTAAEIGLEYNAKHGRQDAVEVGEEYLREIENTNQDAQFILDNIGEIPEAGTPKDKVGYIGKSPDSIARMQTEPDLSDRRDLPLGPPTPEPAEPDRRDLPLGPPTPESPEPDRRDLPLGPPTPESPEPGYTLPPIRIESPSVRELDEALNDESRTMLGAMLPGYERDVVEIDDLLESEGIERSPSPDTRPDTITSPDTSMGRWRELDPPVTSTSTDEHGQGGRPRIPIYSAAGMITGWRDAMPGELEQPDTRPDVTSPDTSMGRWRELESYDNDKRGGWDGSSEFKPPETPGAWREFEPYDNDKRGGWDGSSEFKPPETPGAWREFEPYDNDKRGGWDGSSEFKPPETPGAWREFEPYDKRPDTPDTSMGRWRELDSSQQQTSSVSERYKPITETFNISDDNVPPESYDGLPVYYPLIIDTEGGMRYNEYDPSTAGVWQTTYNEFLNSAEAEGGGYPADVRHLSPQNVRDFYQWYHGRTAASVNGRHMPSVVKNLFRDDVAFQYMYSDAAVHHGHGGVASIATQFASLYAEGDDPFTIINKFDQQRKAYMRQKRNNQITKVKTNYNNGNISLHERDTKIARINRLWASLMRRASNTASRARQMSEMAGGIS